MLPTVPRFDWSTTSTTVLRMHVRTACVLGRHRMQNAAKATTTFRRRCRLCTENKMIDAKMLS